MPLPTKSITTRFNERDFMKIMIAICSLVLFGACTSSTSPTPAPAAGTAPAPSPVLSPLQDVGCEIESAVTSSFANTIANSFSCKNTSVIQANLQTAFGNANLCPKVTPAMTIAKAQAVHAKGIVGNIACPLAISTAIGYLTSQIPTAWGCSAQVTAASLTSTLTTACEAAVPL